MKFGWLLEYFKIAELAGYCMTYCQKNLNEKLQNMPEQTAMHFTEYTQGQNNPQLGGHLRW
jgi:hypothetical protein